MKQTHCEECGAPLPEGATKCPECGCPVQVQAEEASKQETSSENVKEEKPTVAENSSNSSSSESAASVDKDILNQSKSTEAETESSDVSEQVLRVGNIIAIIGALLLVIAGIIQYNMYSDLGQGDIGFWTCAVYVVVAIIYYYLTTLFTKAFCAIIKLLVNISTTLKRIEIKLDKDGTL